MDKEPTQPVEDKALSPDEEIQMNQGMALYEMTQTEGWKIYSKQLEQLAYHSWVDPRETNSKEEWMWQELNAFHGANNAKESLEWVQKEISDAEYLHKIKTGKVTRNKRMTI